MSKVIHQIFLDIGLKPLSERHDYLRNIELLKVNNPDWCYLLWNEDELDEFVENEYPEYLDYWNSFPHKFYKIDYARYLLLKSYGGIYIDLDEENIKPLDVYILRATIISGVWYEKKNKCKTHNHNNNILSINNTDIIDNEK